MILPNRKTIRPLLEEQKFQSAKEGLALASKVQALREEYNQIVKNRNEFIQGTVAEVEKATKIKSDKLKELQSQIEILEAKRVELLKPLNAEWKELELAQEELGKKEKEFVKKESHLEATRRDVTKRLQEMSLQAQKTTLLAQETFRLNDEAKEEKINARQILNDAILNRDEIEKECAERLVKVSELENQVDFEKQGLENLKNTYLSKEKDLLLKEKQIKDREQTLLRNIKRYEQRSKKR